MNADEFTLNLYNYEQKEENPPKLKFDRIYDTLRGQIASSRL